MTERTCETCAWGVKVQAERAVWQVKCMYGRRIVKKKPSDSCRHHATTRGWSDEKPPETTGALDRLLEALTPSAETKAAYIGEFSFQETDIDEEGDEHLREVMVPWTTIKEIMKAIRARGTGGGEQGPEGK